MVKHTIYSVDGNTVKFQCNVTREFVEYDASSLVLVTIRKPVDQLYFALAGTQEELLESLPFGILRIGDCLAPATVAAAVYDGHRAAQELDNLPDPDIVPFKRDRPMLGCVY